MEICSYTAHGYEGCIVTVEIDLRRGIPGTEIIGLPDNAVKEARERVRTAIKNSDFEFPRDRLLINLTPAGIKKEGSHFDLAIALAILMKANDDFNVGENILQTKKIMAVGELELSGHIRPAHGLMAALATAKEQGVDFFIIPRDNIAEAEAVVAGAYWPAENLQEAYQLFLALLKGQLPERKLPENQVFYQMASHYEVDLADIKGQPILKRALEIAAAGRHNLFFFGPPGCGKTMTAKAIASILPPLTEQEALETNRIYSIKGEITNELLAFPPFRTPHHTSSPEGIIGGGRHILPGEVSLAHNGVLFLDESFEFNKSLLQTLREPLESRKVTLARAGQTLWYPANFQLLLAANVCPCGSMGRVDKVCMCSPNEIARYWRRLGGAILDRVDIRLPALPVDAKQLLSEREERSDVVRARVSEVKNLQLERYQNYDFKANALLPAAYLREFCALSSDVEEVFILATKKLELSSRASHSILRVARTIADMEASNSILKEHILEATSYRRYGDSDLYWTTI